MILYIVIFIAAGIFSGFLSGLFGIGGGIMRVPIFVFIYRQFGVSEEIVMHMAAGTSLALVIPSSITASWEQYRWGKLDLTYFKSWAVALTVGVLIGLVIFPLVPTLYLEGLFVLVLLLIAFYIGFGKEGWTIAKRPPEGWPKYLLSGVIGIWSVLTGIAGGAFTTPSLKACSYPLKKAIALATATGFVIGTVGAIGAVISGLGVGGRPPHSWGFVDPIVLAAMVIPVLVTAPLGAWCANIISREKLKFFYALFLLLMAGYMIFDMVF